MRDGAQTLVKKLTNKRLEAEFPDLQEWKPKSIKTFLWINLKRKTYLFYYYCTWNFLSINDQLNESTANSKRHHLSYENINYVNHRHTVYPKLIKVAIKTTLVSYSRFTVSLVKLLFSNLFNGANFARRATVLEMLTLVFILFYIWYYSSYYMISKKRSKKIKIPAVSISCEHSMFCDSLKTCIYIFAFGVYNSKQVNLSGIQHCLAQM